MAIYRIRRLFSVSEKVFGIAQEIKMITENLRRLNASGGSKKLIAEQQAKLSKMQETLKRQQQAGAEIARAKKNVKSTQTQINDLTAQMKGTRGKTRQGFQQQINTLQTNSQGQLNQAMENLQGLKGKAPVNNVTVNYTGQNTRKMSNFFKKKPEVTVNNISNDKLIKNPVTTSTPGNKLSTTTTRNTPKSTNTQTTSNTPATATTTNTTPNPTNTPTAGNTPANTTTPTTGSTGAAPTNAAPTTNSGGTPTSTTNNDGSWWSRQSNASKGLMIGGGALAAGSGLGYALSKKKPNNV
jgi:hypothetical protein